MIEALSNNLGFLGGVYNVNALIAPIILISAWDAVWKAVALWRAARMRMLWWFIALWLINSMGIFPIIFILFTKKQYQKSQSVTKT